jgi:hypothetical protein
MITTASTAPLAVEASRGARSEPVLASSIDGKRLSARNNCSGRPAQPGAAARIDSCPGASLSTPAPAGQRRGAVRT